MLEQILENLLDSKEIQPVNPKGNWPWIFIGRTDAKAEALMLWPPGAKSWLIGKDPDAGKDWGQKEKRATEDEMFGWITDSMDMSLSKLWEIVKDRKVWRAAVHAVAKSWTQLSNWKTTQRNHFSAYFKIVFKRKRQSLPPSQIPSSFLFRVLSSLFMQVCPIMMVTMPITYLAPVKWFPG